MRRRAAALALLVAGCAAQPPPRPAGVPPTLRALALPAVGPAPYDPGRLPGQVVVVNYMATWCFPCLAELPAFEMLQRDLGPRGLQVVLVGLDLEGERVLAPFAQHYALRVPLLVADEATREGNTAYGPIRALPTTVLVDREGRAVQAWVGVTDTDALRVRVERELGR